MTIPDEIADLVQQRETARAARDFARADALRDEIAARGFTLTDTPDGAHLEPKAAYALIDPARIERTLDQPATKAFSFHLLYEGYSGDVERFLAGLRAHDDTSGIEIVLVANGAHHDEVERFADDEVRTLHLDHAVGWAAARNAGLKQAAGEIVVLVDLSIEPTGPILPPLWDAFDDPDVGIAGPFGLKTENLRLFADDPGPEVHAIEGYLLAVRREHLARELIREKFQWYRNADIDLSFQVRATGAKAIVVRLPVTKHTHRGWTDATEDDRARLSKRNHYTFFDRWKHTPLAPGR